MALGRCWRGRVEADATLRPTQTARPSRSHPPPASCLALQPVLVHVGRPVSIEPCGPGRDGILGWTRNQCDPDQAGATCLGAGHVRRALPPSRPVRVRFRSAAVRLC